VRCCFCWRPRKVKRKRGAVLLRRGGGLGRAALEVPWERKAQMAGRGEADVACCLDAMAMAGADLELLLAAGEQIGQKIRACGGETRSRSRQRLGGGGVGTREAAKTGGARRRQRLAAETGEGGRSGRD
jgi:hypothetical protein